MAIAFRVRVTWDDTVIEDRLLAGELRIGAGPRANVPAPGPDGRYVTVRARGRGFEVSIPPGVAEAVELPGEPRTELGGREAPLVLTLAPPFGSARLYLPGTPATLVELERVGYAQPSDRALWAWVAASTAAALLLGGSYTMLRRAGEAPKVQRPPRLSASDAARVRVRLGPDGPGAMRPQAGLGHALRARPQTRPTAPPTHAAPGFGVVEDKAAEPQAGSRLATGLVGRPTPVVAAGRTHTGRAAQRRTEPPRAQLIEDAQAALLQADLRKAVDTFSRAGAAAPLDYDQLNWLGLAHYLMGQYDDAERVWSQARALEPQRVDAINNLASVAKRRGEPERELALLKEALELQPTDCHVTNSLALEQARSGALDDAAATLERSDGFCGGGYAYTAIQRAAILSYRHEDDQAIAALEEGLERVDTLIPIKEFEVFTDLTLDPAFARLRQDPRFAPLQARYLPRAAGWKDAPGLAGAPLITK